MMMRQRSRQPDTSIARLMMTALLELGLTVIDLAMVWSSLPTPGHVASLTVGGAMAAPSTAAEGGVARGGDAGRLTVVSVLAARQPAARAQPAAWGDLGGKRPADPLARVLLLATVVPSVAFAGDCPLLRHAPWRPAREVGANLSIPRPPPR
jgi:hypothetical protein